MRQPARCDVCDRELYAITKSSASIFDRIENIQKGAPTQSQNRFDLPFSGPAKRLKRTFKNGFSRRDCRNSGCFLIEIAPQTKEFPRAAELFRANRALGHIAAKIGFLLCLLRSARSRGFCSIGRNYPLLTSINHS